MSNAELNEEMSKVRGALKAPRGAIAIEVAVGRSTQWIWAYPTSVAGLVAHKTLHTNTGWVVTHASSGNRVIDPVPTRKEAAEIAERLGKQRPDIDWTRPAADLYTGYVTAGGFVERLTQQDVLEALGKEK